MRPFARPRQIEGAAPLHHLEPVFEINPQSLFKRERPRLTIHQSQHDNAKSRLQRRQLKQLRHRVGYFGAPLQFDHQPHHVLSVGFIAQVRQSFQFATAGQAGDAFNQRGLVGLKRQLADDDP